MTPVTLVGATGLTGSQALSFLLASPANFAVTTLTRRAAPAPTTPPKAPGATYDNRVLSDLASADKVAEKGGIYISALGTTRAAAGGVEQQIAIDRDLNATLADKAKADGADTIILVSSTGASSSSWFAYPKMKGELEDHVVNLKFPNTIILRPAMLLHDNNRRDPRASESAMVKVIRCMRSVGLPTTSLGVETEHVGQAIAQLAAKPISGVNYLYDADIERLAKEYRESLGGKA